MEALECSASTHLPVTCVHACCHVHYQHSHYLSQYNLRLSCGFFLWMWNFPLTWRILFLLIIIFLHQRHSMLTHNNKVIIFTSMSTLTLAVTNSLLPVLKPAEAQFPICIHRLMHDPATCCPARRTSLGGTWGTLASTKHSWQITQREQKHNQYPSNCVNRETTVLIMWRYVWLQH